MRYFKNAKINKGHKRCLVSVRFVNLSLKRNLTEIKYEDFNVSESRRKCRF